MQVPGNCVVTRVLRYSCTCNVDSARLRWPLFYKLASHGIHHVLLSRILIGLLWVIHISTCMYISPKAHHCSFCACESPQAHLIVPWPLLLWHCPRSRYSFACFELCGQGAILENFHAALLNLSAMKPCCQPASPSHSVTNHDHR